MVQGIEAGIPAVTRATTKIAHAAIPNLPNAFGALTLSQKNRDLIGLARDIITRRDGQEHASRDLMGSVSRHLAIIGGDTTPPGIAAMAKQLKGMSEQPDVLKPVVTGLATSTRDLTKAVQTIGSPVTGGSSQYADLFRDRTRLSATDYSVRNGRFTEHYGSGMSSQTTTIVYDQRETNYLGLRSDELTRTLEGAEKGHQVGATAYRGQSRTQARTGQRAPLRGG